MELLSPAGSPEHLKVALEAGANAVYLGGKLFSARKFAGNFSNDDLVEAVRLAHTYGSAVYLTLNTLINDKEMHELREFLHFLKKVPLDGILVQDFGVAREVRNIVPHIPLHASTQMTVSNVEGARFLKELGFQRVVLSRELSIQEIKKIIDEVDIEVEVFVHGALCVCYSGQCLMSSFIGGRSGNRGSCAQPCRMPYNLVNAKGKSFTDKMGKYIISLKDSMGLDKLLELEEIGVASLKIEGRMKSNEYVYRTVNAYRQVIDALHTHKNLPMEELKIQLMEEFNRGYTSAYLDGKVDSGIITELAPGNHGVDAGTVIKVQKNHFLFRGTFKQDFETLNGISYETKDRTIQFVPRDKIESMGSSVYKVYSQVSTFSGSKVYFHVAKEKVSVNFKDFKNKIPLYGKVVATAGNPIVLTLWDDEGNTVNVESPNVAEKAISKITTKEDCIAQLERLGNTPFVLRSLTVNNKECMLPKSILNKLRQQGVEEITNLRVNRYEEKIPKQKEVTFPGVIKKEEYPQEASLWVRCNTLLQLKSAHKAGVKNFIFGGESYDHRLLPCKEYEEALNYCEENHCIIYFATPRVVNENNMPKAKRAFLAYANLRPNGIFIDFPGAFEWMKELTIALPVIVGSSFNIFNQSALKQMEDWGVSGAYFSSELTIPQMRDIAKGAHIPTGAMIAGYTEMMISEYCVINSVLAGTDKAHCPAPCRNDKYFLEDREGRSFPVKTDEWCHMHILNSRPLSMLPYVKDVINAGISFLQLDIRGMDGSVEVFCRKYIEAFHGKVFKNDEEGDKITRGHFFKGVI